MMISTTKKSSVSAAVLGILGLFSIQAHATNGYFTHGVGVKNMAGAGSAMSAYQSKTIMQDFDSYSDLFANDFDVPANALIGASRVATNTLTLHFDVERTWCGDIDSVGNSIANFFARPTAGFGSSTCR